MRGVFLVILALILLPGVIGASQHVDLDISKNDIVREEIYITFESDDTYDAFEFQTTEKPVAVEFDSTYTISPYEDTYIITFDQQITPGENTVAFSLILDDLVVTQGADHAFRTEFMTITDELTVSLTLPEGYVLAKDPSATPKPASISSDGRRITLHWAFEDDYASLAVFYRGGTVVWTPYLAALIIVVVASAAIFRYFKRQMKKAVHDTLSEDEAKVVEQLRSGITVQKDIARNLEFSKSKISKVIRKLEEKDLVEKSAHFKTNKIRLKKI